MASHLKEADTLLANQLCGPKLDAEGSQQELQIRVADFGDCGAQRLCNMSTSILVQIQGDFAKIHESL